MDGPVHSLKGKYWWELYGGTDCILLWVYNNVDLIDGGLYYTMMKFGRQC